MTARWYTGLLDSHGCRNDQCPSSFARAATADALVGQTWAQVDAAIKGLDALDLQAASDQSRSAALWEQAKANLSTAEYLAFSRLIGAPTSPSHEESVVVQRGDTLIGLAARFLNDQARWKEIYQLNQVEIGPDPGTISGGQKLKLPKS